MIIDQCLSARLQVKQANVTEDQQFVEIGRGVIVSVCFLKNATFDTVQKMAKIALNTKLSGDHGKRVSVSDLPDDVLIIPGSTIGGQLRGRRFTYHHLIDKEKGRVLYEEFVRVCTELAKKNENMNDKRVAYGSYDYRHEAIRLESDGLFTHLFEF